MLSLLFTKLFGLINLAPSLAKLTLLAAGASMKVAWGGYAVATVCDWVVPGLPVGSLLVVALAGPVAIYRLFK